MSIHAFPAPAVLPVVAAARELVTSGASVGVASVPDGEVGEAIAELAALEAQVEAWRLALEAEADARALAERDAATGTDAWVAALTGSTREAAAGGIRLARLFSEKYAATREAFAAGRLRIEQVRVIVNAAEQIPATATPEGAMAEEWLVAQGTGDGTRDHRPRDARRLRRAAHRMCAPISHELMLAHQDVMLGREERAAEAETWLSLGDNGNGTWTGKFVIPALHGQLLQRHLDTLTAPRRLSRDRDGDQVSDPTLPGVRAGTVLDRTDGAGVHRAPRAPAHRRPRRQRHHPAHHPRPRHPADRASVPPASRPATTSPPARPAAWPATPASSPPSSAPTPHPWTSAARPACTPRPNARPSP